MIRWLVRQLRLHRHDWQLMLWDESPDPTGEWYQCSGCFDVFCADSLTYREEQGSMAASSDIEQQAIWDAVHEALNEEVPP